MPVAPYQTRAQLLATARQLITDPLNQQNTAQAVRTLIEAVNYSNFNKAEDQLDINKVAGLESALNGLTSTITLTYLQLSGLTQANTVIPWRLYRVTARPGNAEDVYCVFLRNQDNTAALAFLRSKPGEFFAYDVTNNELLMPDEAAAQSVPLYDPNYNATGTPPGYPVDFLVRYTLLGTEGFYAANVAGQLPAPTDPDADANWRRVAGPTAAVTIFQRLPSVNVARALASDEALYPGRVYAITRYDKVNNVPLPTVNVAAAEVNAYDLEQASQQRPDGSWEAGSYNLTADTFTPGGTGGGGTAGVSSFNGRTGAVTATKSDVGLGNVDNTSDASKPISTATASALAGKAAASHTHPATQITGLATVATSGSYNDLTNKPSIPAATPIANNLTTTAAGSALDARQGKVLDDQITVVENDLLDAENELLDHENRITTLEDNSLRPEQQAKLAALASPLHIVSSGGYYSGYETLDDAIASGQLLDGTLYLSQGITAPGSVIEDCSIRGDGNFLGSAVNEPLLTINIGGTISDTFLGRCQVRAARYYNCLLDNVAITDSGVAFDTHFVDNVVVSNGTFRIGAGCTGNVAGITTTGSGVVIDERTTGSPVGGTGIDFTNPATLTAAATLAINTAYCVTGSGYTLTLPSATSNIGAAVFVSIAPTATGLYPVGALTLYAGESINLRATADGWKKTGGELLGMSARIETTLSQQDAVPTGTLYIVPMATVVQNVAAVPALVDTSNNAVVVQRAGQGTLNGVVCLKNAVPGATYFIGIALTKPGQGLTAPVQIVCSVPNGGVVQESIVLTQTFAAGDKLQLYVYAEGSAANLRGQYNGSQCSLSFTEFV